MLSEDAKSVAEEIRAAETTATLHHTPIRAMIAQYSGGKWFRDDMTCEPTPENHAYAWADWMEPQLAYAAPASLVEANWEKSHGDIAKWMESCQRRNAAVYPIVDDFRMWVLDIIFGYGVLKVGVETVDGKPNPCITHVPIDQWGCATGPGVSSLKDSPLQYHRYDVDMDDLPLMEDVDPAALTKVKNTYEPDGDTGTTGAKPTRTADRKRFRVYDVWFTKARKVGTLLSAGGTDPMDVWLRPPRAWVGPKCGPFIVTGLKRVPNSPYFMSPLMAVMAQIQSLNAHLRAQALEADSMRSFWAVDADFPDLAKKLEEAKSTGILVLEGLKTNPIQKIDVGGVHPGRIEHTNQMLERVERYLAMGDAVQGISNSDTATANKIAADKASIRVEYAREIVNGAAAIALKAQMWYMFHDPAYEEKISFTMDVPQPMPMQPMMGGMPGMMPPQQPGMGMPPADPMMQQPTNLMNPMGGGMGMNQPPITKPQQMEAYFHGGTEGGFYRGEWFPPQEDLDWESDFTVTVDPNSTSHTSNTQKLTDAMTLLQVQQTGYQMLVTMQGCDVENVINKIGEAMNIRNLFKQLYSADLVAMAQAMNPMMQTQLPQSGQPAMGGAQQPGRPMLPPGAMGGMNSGGSANLRQSGGSTGGKRAGFGVPAGRGSTGGQGAGRATTSGIGAGGGGF